jgi:DNA-binding MarR family transcriptional regulator
MYTYYFERWIAPMKINESFGYIINLTAKNMKKKLDERIKQYDITTAQWAVLKLLSEVNDLTQVEVAERLSSDRATTGAVIDKLINKKLIERNQCESDKRAYRVRISDYGLELASKISSEAVKCNVMALEDFDHEQIEQLLSYLYKVNNNLSRE